MKYHIFTYGCQMNKSDSQRLAWQLEEKGYQLAENWTSADLIIFNLCSVREKAVEKVYQRILQIKNKSPQKKIVLTGCLLEADKEKFKKVVDEIWPIVNFSQPTKHCPEKKFAYVPIMTGCNNFCSYCVVPYTRGREISRPAQEIIQEIKNLIKQGYQEIILLGQNVNSYKDKPKPCLPAGGAQNAKRKDIEKKQKEINFAQLLKMINSLPGDFKIRFLTNHPKDMTDELIETIAQCEKIEKYIHLPAQAGDDEILRKMNRGYTIKDYKKLIEKIRKKIPQAEISSDFIVGFPGETEKQFQKTVDLVKEIKFNQIYVACYSPRPGTAAFRLKDDIPLTEKKKRQQILLKAWRESKKQK